MSSLSDSAPARKTVVEVKDKNGNVSTRNGSVSYFEFAQAFKGSKTLDEVCEKVKAATGVSITVANAKQKAYNLRSKPVAEGGIPNLPKLRAASVGTSGRKRSAEDLAKLNELFAETAPAAETPAAS